MAAFLPTAVRNGSLWVVVACLGVFCGVAY
jgi:hypothetical protein